MRKLTLILVLALAVGTVAVAGEYKCSKGVADDTQNCLNMMAAKLENKGWVGLHLDQTEDGAYKIEMIVEESPAQAAGFKVGDKLVALNGVRFGEANEEALHKEWENMKPGKKVSYTVARGTKEMQIAVTLAQLPDEVLAQRVGQHMLEHASVAQAQK
jgi:predicted metalloprotease with PDZ domain